MAQVPFELVVDRCLIHGDPAAGQKRGIALNSGDDIVELPHLRHQGRGAGVPGNRRLERPGAIHDREQLSRGCRRELHARRRRSVDRRSDRRRHQVPPQPSLQAGRMARRGWTVKNLFELKSARRVLVEGNVMEYSWLHGADGIRDTLDAAQPGRRRAVGDDRGRHDPRSTWCVTPAAGCRSRGRTETTRAVGRNGSASQTTCSTRSMRTLGRAPARSSSSAKGRATSSSYTTRCGRRATSDRLRRAPRRAAPVARFRFRDNLMRHNEYGVHGYDRAAGMDIARAPFSLAPSSQQRHRRWRVAAISRRQSLRDAKMNSTSSSMTPPPGDFRLRPNSRFRGRDRWHRSGGGHRGADAAGRAAADGAG